MKTKIIIAAFLASVATSALAQPASSPAAPRLPGKPATSTISSAPMTDSNSFRRDGGRRHCAAALDEVKRKGPRVLFAGLFHSRAI